MHMKRKAKWECPGRQDARGDLKKIFLGRLSSYHPMITGGPCENGELQAEVRKVRLPDSIEILYKPQGSLVLPVLEE